MFKPYQLAVAIVLFWACLSPEVTSFARNFNHGRPNATHYAPAQNYPGYNNTRPNIGFQNHYPQQQPIPVYNGGVQKPYYHGANYTGVSGGYRPHNSTSVFGRLFKFW